MTAGRHSMVRGILPWVLPKKALNLISIRSIATHLGKSQPSMTQLPDSQALYDQAKVEPDDAKREQLVFEMMKVHIDEGPFFIGTIANIPTIVAFSDNVGNVPTKDQLGTGGFTNPWIMVYFGAVYPEQFYYMDVGQ